MKKPIIQSTKTEIKNLEDDLTLKQKAFLKRYFETGNGTKAALEVYDCKDEGSAAEIASQNLRKLKNPIKAFMESKGLSLGSLVEKVKEGQEATRTTNAAILVQKDGTVVKAEEQGLIEVPDYNVRHKYVETAAKWLGVEVDYKTAIQQQIVQSVTSPIPILGNMVAGGEMDIQFVQDDYQNPSTEEIPATQQPLQNISIEGLSDEQIESLIKQLQSRRATFNSHEGEGPANIQEETTKEKTNE